MHPLTLSRRQVLQALAAASLRAAAPQTLPRWTPGTLDIHHISTGRGSCAFLICPDATTLMIDAGAIGPGTEGRYLIDAYPDAARLPGEWIARYVRRQLHGLREPSIDTLILTHFHPDHMDAIPQLAGLVPVRRLIDRDYPGYRYPAPLEDPPQLAYREFVARHTAAGGLAERFIPGSCRQIRLERDAAQWTEFSIRNIVANGEVWTGTGDETRRMFPELRNLAPAQYPTENMCSLGLRLSYGKFDYYSAGDMSHDTNYGADPWRDIETPAARAAGPVEVAVANHHGYVDATGPEFVRALRPRAFVINAWDSAHPTIAALHNMLSRQLYPGDREIYATAMKPEARIATRRMAELASDNGHVVFRVPPHGTAFEVFIASNADEEDRVVKHFGPFPCG